MPEAQTKEARGTFCYFVRAGSHRWNKSGSQARGPTDPHPTYDRDDNEEGMNYAARRSTEVPDHRPQSVFRYEDHIEHCYGFINLCSWKDPQEHTRLSRERYV